jgi:hypothetical protein
MDYNFKGHYYLHNKTNKTNKKIVKYKSLRNNLNTILNRNNC